ncbi:MAG: leucine-rich repeat domain-containing protein [Treponemataceae bacterium]|nr:leucine-rich repeat domain-containing protein [Treponemataceae bacterium]
MKKTVKVVALIAAMVLTAGFAACQKKDSAGASGGKKASSRGRAHDATPYLLIDGTTVLGYRDGLPANIFIPEGVTAIGKEAFKGSGITDVTIPGSVTEIGKEAFRGYSLKSVTISDGVPSIGVVAFRGCINLESVAIPASVTSIEASAFLECETLESVTIPEGVTTIGFQAFRDCKSLTSVAIPEGVTEIGWRAFMECNSLRDVTIPASVTFIGTNAFSWCGGLKEIRYAGTKAQWNEIKTNKIVGAGYDSVYNDKVTGEKKIGDVIVSCTDGIIKTEHHYEGNNI